MMPPTKSIDRESFSAIVPPEKIPFGDSLPCKILSLDGGGIKGIFTACYLAELERLADGGPISNYFHMIAGTSTGGIIALGLGKGLSAAEIASLYLDHGAEIFSQDRWNADNLLWLGELVKSHPDGWLKNKAMFLHDVKYSKYSDIPLMRLMDNIVGDTKFGESCVALCVPSVDGNRHQPVIFKTPHHPDFELDWEKTMLEVGMGTAAAPTYFKPSEDENYILLDGALIGNNPLMIAIVDILSRTNVPADQIRSLSINCGGELPEMTEKQIGGAGLYEWRFAVDHFNYYQSKNAVGQAKLMTGPQNVHRVEPRKENRNIEMDDFENASKRLPEDARHKAQEDFKVLQSVLFKEPVTPLPFFHGPKKA